MPFGSQRPQQLAFNRRGRPRAIGKTNIQRDFIRIGPQHFAGCSVIRTHPLLPSQDRTSPRTVVDNSSLDHVIAEKNPVTNDGGAAVAVGHRRAPQDGGPALRELFHQSFFPPCQVAIGAQPARPICGQCAQGQQERYSRGDPQGIHSVSLRGYPKSQPAIGLNATSSSPTTPSARTVPRKQNSPPRWITT